LTPTQSLLTAFNGLYALSLHIILNILTAYSVHYEITASLLPIAPFSFIVINKSKTTVQYSLWRARNRTS